MYKIVINNNIIIAPKTSKMFLAFKAIFTPKIITTINLKDENFDLQIKNKNKKSKFLAVFMFLKQVFAP